MLRPTPLRAAVRAALAVLAPALAAAPVAAARAQVGDAVQGAATLAAPDFPRARVTAALEAERERQGLVGLAVGVVVPRGDGLALETFHLGHADREAAVPVSEDTLFRWASISKPVTAVAAMQLVEAGRLDLDRDVRAYVPEFPEKPWPVTARQLLCHQGGVVHYTNGEVVRREREYDAPHPYADVVTALDAFAPSPLVAEPGTKYSYTTHGYILLGAVVQRAGEERFADQVGRRIAAPLGMSTFRPDYQWEDLPGRAVGYRRVAGVVVRSSDTDVSWKLPGGGYVSSVRDLARFAAGLCGEQLLPRAVLDRMWTAQELADGTATGYGLGFGVRRDGDGALRVSHSGSQEKTRTLMQVRPDERRAVVLMTNSEWANLGQVAPVVWAALER